MSNFAKDVQLLSPVPKKAMPDKQKRAHHQIDMLTRAKARISELMEEVHQ